MTAAGKADRGHPGGDCGGNPGAAVLDDDAASRLGADPRRGMEKEVGRRLAARDLGSAKDVRPKAFVEPNQRKSMAQPLGTAARRNAAAANQRINDSG